MVENIDPIVPEGTPLPTPPVGVPPYPITPFAVWTWDSPVIPSFYWNIYSSEQRVKMICKEIGKIEAYLNYLVNKTNENLIDLQKQITVLDTRLTALEKKLAEEVARLNALIAKLREDLTAETKAREDADKGLHQEISTETTARIHADDGLHTEISTEVQARQDADTTLEAKLTGEIAKRLLPTEVTAGDEISITQPDPNSNRIVIASTVAHSISDLRTSVSGVKAALEAEVSERRAEDTKLWQAVNQRIERGKILAGEGIKVVNDPDSTTVTISTTGSGSGGVTPIKGVAPVLVLPNEETGGYSIGAQAATELTAGTITEARVKELAAKATTVEGTAPVTVQARSASGPGLQTGTIYTIGVSPATATTLGGVKVGAGLKITADGTLSAPDAAAFEDVTISNIQAENGASAVDLSKFKLVKYGQVLFALGNIKVTLPAGKDFSAQAVYFGVTPGIGSSYRIETAGIASPSRRLIPVEITFDDHSHCFITLTSEAEFNKGEQITVYVNGCTPLTY